MQKMDKLGLGALLAIGLGIAGFFVGGYLGDALWSMANDHLPKCSELEPSKETACVNENRDYYAINMIFLFGGVLIPLMITVFFVRRIK